MGYLHLMLLGSRYGLHASPGNRSSNSSLYFSADLPGMHTVWLSAYAGAPPGTAAGRPQDLWVHFLP